MNVRRVTTRTEGGQIHAQIEAGHATTPIVIDLQIDPATALVLASQLESAVHTVCPDGVAPSLSTPNQIPTP